MAHTPWREALDAKLRLMRYFETDAFFRAHDFVGLGNDEGVRMPYTFHREHLTETEPIWVADNISRGLLKNACDENTVFDMLSLTVPKYGLIWFERPLVRSLTFPNSKGTANARIRGILYGMLYDAEQLPEGALIVCAWQETDKVGGFYPVTVAPIMGNTTIEDWILKRALAFDDSTLPKDVLRRMESIGISNADITTLDGVDSVRHLYGFIMQYIYTLFSFMNQRILVTNTEQVERSARRSAERQNVPSDVRVVTWRLKKYERMETETQQVDWSCHWSSKAHDRHLADGRVIPIPASIKGDLTKPYKPPTPNVHVVTRE
jgi:hypothetical protein